MPEKFFLSATGTDLAGSAAGERVLWSGHCAVAEYAFEEPSSLPRWTLPEETEVLVFDDRVLYRDAVTGATGELHWRWPQHLRVQPGSRDTGRSATVTQIQLVCVGPDNSFPALVFAGGELTTVRDADRLANVLRQTIARYRVEHAAELRVPAPQVRMLSRLVIGPEFSNYQGGGGQTVSLLGSVAVAPPVAPRRSAVYGVPPEPLPAHPFLDTYFAAGASDATDHAAGSPTYAAGPAAYDPGAPTYAAGPAADDRHTSTYASGSATPTYSTAVANDHGSRGRASGTAHDDHAHGHATGQAHDPGSRTHVIGASAHDPGSHAYASGADDHAPSGVAHEFGSPVHDLGYSAYAPGSATNGSGENAYGAHPAASGTVPASGVPGYAPPAGTPGWPMAGRPEFGATPPQVPRPGFDPSTERRPAQPADDVSLRGTDDLDVRAADLAARVARLVSGRADLERYETHTTNLSAYLPPDADESPPGRRAEQIRRTAARLAANSARSRNIAPRRSPEDELDGTPARGTQNNA